MATSRRGRGGPAARPPGASSAPRRTRSAPAGRAASRRRLPATGPAGGTNLGGSTTATPAATTTATAGTPPSGRTASLTGRATALALVFGVLAVSYSYPLRTWIEQRERISELHAEQAQLTADVERLRADIGRWDDPAYVRAQARERLSFVLPGEISYIVIDPGEEAAGAAAAVADARSADASPWWARLWSAVEVSGTTAGRPGTDR